MWEHQFFGKEATKSTRQIQEKKERKKRTRRASLFELEVKMAFVVRKILARIGIKGCDIILTDDAEILEYNADKTKYNGVMDIMNLLNSTAYN